MSLDRREGPDFRSLQGFQLVIWTHDTTRRDIEQEAAPRTLIGASTEALNDLSGGFEFIHRHCSE
jgi:hypothetical protein